MKQQLMTMLEMQEAMNSRVNREWRSKNYEWYRAIWIECAELMDHFGWKWWKKQSADHDQVILELIDIWHFGLSIVLSNTQSLEEGAEMIAKKFSVEATNGGDFREKVEAFATQTLASRDFDVSGFTALMSGVELSFAELYKRYIGKNVLNFFRQDNGYQDGHYKKLWSGREDNEHLVEVVDCLDVDDALFKDKVYALLAERYHAAG